MMNFGEIKTLVEFYIHRVDYADKWPAIFELIRERISKDARLIVMETTVVPTVADKAFPLPDDFIEMINLTAQREGRVYSLDYYPKKQLDALSNQRTGAFGFTILGNQVELQSGEAPLSLTYYARPGQLVEDDDTNAVLTNWPSLYLHLGIAYAANGMQDTETENVAKGNYASELAQANDSDEAGRHMGGGLKIVGG